MRGPKMWKGGVGGGTTLRARLRRKDRERSGKTVENVFEKGTWGDRDRGFRDSGKKIR